MDGALLTRAAGGDQTATLILGALLGASLLLGCILAIRKYLSETFVSQEQYLKDELERYEKMDAAVGGPMAGVQKTLGEIFDQQRATNEKISSMNRELGVLGESIKNQHR